MSALADLLRGRTGLTDLSVNETSQPVMQPTAPSPTVAPSANPFTWGSRPPVAPSSDLDRVLSIPRRPQESLYSEELVERLTQQLRRPGGTMRLLPMQAAGLYEAPLVDGLFCMAPVGEGKALLSWLLPTVLNSRVAVLLVPASLKVKAINLDYPRLSKHWRIPNLAGSDVVYRDTPCLLHLVSYSQLSSQKGADVLDRIKPDLIVCDESHSLKDSGASRTKRANRSIKANPGVRVCVLSGSPANESPREFAHLMRYALKSGAPVPSSWPVLEEWSCVLEAKNWDPTGNPTNPPGALDRLCAPGEDVREGFRRRLVETRGVIAPKTTRLPVALNFYERKVKIPPKVQTAVDALVKDWVTPDDVWLVDALEYTRKMREVVTGRYYKWDWSPEQRTEPTRSRVLEWLDVRKEFAKEVREALKGDCKPGMDSPGFLFQAAAEGRWNSSAYSRWSEIRDDFDPPTVAVRIDPFLAEDAVDWGKKNVGIIWYEIEDLGREIAELGGFPFYGGGKAASAAIMSEKGDRTVVASVNAHGTGKDLYAFNKQLVTSISSNGEVNEQLLGRLHRKGQTADEVSTWFYLHTDANRQALRDAIQDAKHAKATLGADKKLLYATYTFDL